MGNVGSYRYTHFESPDAELDRLEKQAQAGLTLEREIWVNAGLGPQMRVLDLGCGPGVVSAAMAEMVEHGSVHGVDASAALLERAHALRERRAIANLQFSIGDVYDLSSSLADYDFAYARFLFQHLEKPQNACDQIHRVLAPGGIACLVDIDDAWLMLEPEPKHFKTFLEAAEQGQAAHGGDRKVGRRLARYLTDAGFEDVETKIKVITSHDLGLDAFLQITTRFKQEQVDDQSRELARNALENIDALLENTEAWGAVGVFVATGKKPGRSENRFQLITSSPEAASAPHDD